MKKTDSQSKISRNSSSMSQYLSPAHLQLLTQKDQYIVPRKKSGSSSQTAKRSLMLQLPRQSQQHTKNKGQRSLSHAIILEGINKQQFSLEKRTSQEATDFLKLPKNHKRNRQSSRDAEALVIKWRNSVAGVQLLKKKKSSFLANQNNLFLKLQQNQRRKSSIIPPQVALTISASSLNKKSQNTLSLSKKKDCGTTKKLYNSIRKYNREEQFWLFHLEQELSLKEVIEQFQKIELNRNVQPSKKLTMRQAYQLKKEIVFEIQQEKSTSIQANIEKLAEIALDEKEKDKFLMIGFFIVLRQKLKIKKVEGEDEPEGKKQSGQSEIAFQYEKEVIGDIKEEIKSWKGYKFEEANIINIKILSILALHIIKLESPTFSFEDLELIANTIRLKKKGQNIIEYLAEEDKVIHFESLIYIIFQFYKNLYYLKLDEEMKIEQYNSLKAYIDLYEARDIANFQRFQDKYRISATIQNIKPASVGIYPYQDSKIRNQIMFRTLQKELHNESSDDGEGASISKKPKIKVNKKSLINHLNINDKDQESIEQSQSQSSKQQASNSDFSSQQESSHLQSKAEHSEVPSHQTMFADSNLKLSIKKQVAHSPSKKVSLRIKLDDPRNSIKKSSNDLKIDQSRKNFNKKNSIQRNEDKIKRLKDKEPFVMKEENFTFDFILVKSTRLCSGSFKLSPSESNMFEMIIQLKDAGEFPLVSFRFKNIRIIPENLTMNGFQKFMWKVFKKIFVINLIPEEDPFLIKEYNQDPEHLKNYNQEKSVDTEFRLLEVIHDYLIFWVKKQPYAYNFSGRSIDCPTFTAEDINKYMENLEYEHDRKMFQKRHGYLDPKSGRKTELSPNKNSRVVFNDVRNDFYVDERPLRQNGFDQKMMKMVKNVMFLVKINLSDRCEIKLVRMLFLTHIRQMSIFQQGVFKHSGTYLVHEKVPQLRKLKNSSKLHRNRLIFQLQKVLRFQFHPYVFDSELDDIMLNKSFHIEQQFEVDLTNQFKFIPSIQIQLVYDILMKDFQLSMIRQEQLFKKRKKCLIRKKIQKDFIIGLESQQARQGTQTNTTNKKKTKTVLTTFKVSLRLFLTAQFQFAWGKRYLSLHKNLQFFEINPNYTLKDLTFTYRIDGISLYRIPLMMDSGTEIFQSFDRNYHFYHVRKPFLSKLNTLIVLGKGQTQGHLKKFGESSKPQIHKGLDSEVVFQQELHFIEEKLYIRLKKQKMMKFILHGKSSYFLLQQYQTIEPPKNFIKESQSNSKLFIYQLTNLKNPQIKYFLSLQEEISFQDSDELKSLIDIEKFTLKGQQMQVFEVPVQKINFQNEFFQKKTKSVRKKVISEANYYFEQRVLAICSNMKNENILINVLQKYRVSKREKFKLS